MTEEMLLEEIRVAAPEKRDTILSYAYFVLHGKSAFSNISDGIPYVPFTSYSEVDDFLEFHQRQTGVI
jgi:hypothetical protein